MRANLLRDAHKVMEARAELVTALGHTVGATTIASGARILGGNATIQALPRPCLFIVGLDNPRNQQGNEKRSSLTLEVHGDDIFEVADVIDELELMCDAYRVNQHTLSTYLHKINFIEDTFIPTPDPAARMAASQITLELIWRKI